MPHRRVGHNDEAYGSFARHSRPMSYAPTSIVQTDSVERYESTTSARISISCWYGVLGPAARRAAPAHRCAAKTYSARILRIELAAPAARLSFERGRNRRARPQRRGPCIDHHRRSQDRRNALDTETILALYDPAHEATPIGDSGRLVDRRRHRVIRIRMDLHALAANRERADEASALCTAIMQSPDRVPLVAPSTARRWPADSS